MTERVTELDLIENAEAKGGDRVTLADVEAAIVGENYYTAGAAVTALGAPSFPGLDVLTICNLTLWNGWTITGTSACADPKSFDSELGKRLAKQDAVRQIWPLMGFELKSRLHREKNLVGKALCSTHGYPTYIGTKVVNAAPLNRLEYNQLRGWELPADENGSDEGYLVEYADLPATPNVDGFLGYISWSPKEVFERAYRRVGKAEAQPSAASPEAAGTASVAEEPKKKTWVDRLQVEHSEVHARYLKLNAFVHGDEINRLPFADRQDLREQLLAMTSYVTILERRMSRILVQSTITLEEKQRRDQAQARAQLEQMR